MHAGYIDVSELTSVGAANGQNESMLPRDSPSFISSSDSLLLSYAASSAVRGSFGRYISRARAALPALHPATIVALARAAAGERHA